MKVSDVAFPLLKTILGFFLGRDSYMIDLYIPSLYNDCIVAYTNRRIANFNCDTTYLQKFLIM